MIVEINPLLLRLHGEISLSLLCSDTSLGSALSLALALHVGYPLASVLHPDRRGLKEWLIRGLWLTHAWGTEGYGMRDESVAAKAVMMLQLPGACHVFSWGCCPWITGPWQGRAAHAPWRGDVDSDLCLHPGFLEAAAAVLAFHAHLWCLR